MNFHIKWKPKAIRVIQKHNMAADFELWSISCLARDFFSFGNEDFVCLLSLKISGAFSYHLYNFKTSVLILFQRYHILLRQLNNHLQWNGEGTSQKNPFYLFNHLLVIDVSVIHHWNSSHMRNLFTSAFTTFAGCISCIQAYSKIISWLNAQGGDVCLWFPQHKTNVLQLS